MGKHPQFRFGPPSVYEGKTLFCVSLYVVMMCKYVPGPFVTFTEKRTTAIDIQVIILCVGRSLFPYFIIQQTFSHQRSSNHQSGQVQEGITISKPPKPHFPAPRLNSRIFNSLFQTNTTCSSEGPNTRSLP